MAHSNPRTQPDVKFEARSYDVQAVLNQEARLRANGKTLRGRALAHAIGVPEAALVEARCLQNSAVPLRRPDGATGYGELLSHLVSAGGIMALTRNEACVSEMHGAYVQPSFHGSMGQVLGEIDLRLMLDHWVYGYAVTDQTKNGERRSLQFFDAAGEAVHKIYATASTDLRKFKGVGARYADAEVAPALFSRPPEASPESADAEIDAVGLLNGWRTLEHSHDFFGLLRKFGVSRPQAMRIGATVFTRPAPVSAVDDVLKAAAEQKIPLMIFVGNRGCIQIFSGLIDRVARVNTWLNVLDSRFNLHLRTDMIENAWLVRKPSARGDVHSLELFDADGFCFAQVFGERKPGTTERGDWRSLVTSQKSA